MKAPVMLNQCPTGCGRARPEGRVMCRHCWHDVPVQLRRNLWHTYRKYQRTHHLNDLRAYRDARAAAIASIR